MKNLLSFTIVFFMLAISAEIYAQDPVKVGPNIYKLLFENERVRVLEITFAPGDSISAHSHPDHLVYVLSNGKLRITEVGKEPMEAELKKGGVMYLSAQTHSAINTGKTELKAVVVELKD